MYWRERKERFLAALGVCLERDLITQEQFDQLMKIAKLADNPEICEINDRVEKQLEAMGIQADLHGELLQLMTPKILQEEPEILGGLLGGLFDDTSESVVTMMVKCTNALLKRIGLEDCAEAIATRNKSVAALGKDILDTVDE